MTPEEILKEDFLSDLDYLLKQYGFKPTQDNIEFVHDKQQIKVVYEGKK